MRILLIHVLQLHIQELKGRLEFCDFVHMYMFKCVSLIPLLVTSFCIHCYCYFLLFVCRVNLFLCIVIHENWDVNIVIAHCYILNRNSLCIC